MSEKNIRLYLLLIFLIAFTSLYNHYNVEEVIIEEIENNSIKEDLIDHKKPVVKKEKIKEEIENNKKEDKKINNNKNNYSLNNKPIKEEVNNNNNNENKEYEVSNNKGHYEERQVLVSRAWIEQVLVKDAWDEYIVTTPAWDEQVEYCNVWGADYIMGYKCSTCGAEFMDGSEANNHLSAEKHLSYYNIQIQTSEEYCKEYAYMTVHHDEIGYTIHHDAEYIMVEHPAEYRTEKYWVDD